jgi:hypothetical protein
MSSALSPSSGEWRAALLRRAARGFYLLAAALLVAFSRGLLQELLLRAYQPGSEAPAAALRAFWLLALVLAVAAQLLFAAGFALLRGVAGGAATLGLAASLYLLLAVLFTPLLGSHLIAAAGRLGFVVLDASIFAAGFLQALAFMGLASSGGVAVLAASLLYVLAAGSYATLGIMNLLVFLQGHGIPLQLAQLRWLAAAALYAASIALAFALLLAGQRLLAAAEALDQEAGVHQA